MLLIKNIVKKISSFLSKNSEYIAYPIYILIVLIILFKYNSQKCSSFKTNLKEIQFERSKEYLINKLLDSIHFEIRSNNFFLSNKSFDDTIKV